MKQNNQHQFDIKNLNCANCALKIESKIKKLDYVTDVNLDFVNKKLRISTTKSIKEILHEINKIASRIEPGVKFTNESHEDNREIILKIIRLFMGFIIFLIAYLSVFTFQVNIYLFLVSYIIIGSSVIYKALKNIIKGNLFDENFLMMIATLAAIYIKSYEEAVFVMLFYEVGELLQDLAVNKSRNSIKKLLDIAPKYANVKANEKIVKVNPEEVKLNDIIIVKPGETIPLDGIIIEGKSQVDTSKLTGESIPRFVEEDMEVLAGFINYNGILEIRVTKLYEDSHINKILELVENSPSKKAKVEKFITRFARIYTPIVIILAVMLVIIPNFFVNDYIFSDYLYRGAIFLVVSCPCALVLSIPLSMFAGLGAASRHGVLIKGGNYLDLVNKVNTVVFDKTRTLTKGNLVVSKVEVINNKYTIDDMMEKAIYAESLSDHATAKAIVNYQNLPINKERITNFTEVFGKGIVTNIDNDLVIIGNDKLMQEYNIEFDMPKEVGTVCFVAINKEYVGYIIINDEIKVEAQKVISDLKKHGINQTIMLTGDNFAVANNVKEILNIDEVYANLLPEDKLNILENIKHNQNGMVMYVGDGVNDTPVLKNAHVGCAMGALGSDIAIEASDCVIMNDDLSKLITLKRIATLTNKKIWQNISLALGIKLFVLILGAFGNLSMWMAIFSDVGVALLTVLNSILILRHKL
ncbi:MAG TPA: heavy metal translocating P-type ATPase [Haloplasmataceae bacterium]